LRNAHRHFELQSVHQTSPELASPKQRRSSSKVALTGLWHENVSSLRKQPFLLQAGRGKLCRHQVVRQSFLTRQRDY
jgi:hypothetical protein